MVIFQYRAYFKYKAVHWISVISLVEGVGPIHANVTVIETIHAGASVRNQLPTGTFNL